ncbi:MAG: nitrogenase-stabilizing/protective protein NifW [Candidatus Thiothrix moscowensis]|nr:nitrogenase-stabilizing/protective protein NifW [Candidatus Thiothrix moscowensis]
MTDTDLTLDLEELVSAEDFLNYFGIAFDQTVVHVNRLHILQRFHNYLAKEPTAADDDALREQYTRLLTKAYGDFVDSDAKTEKVLKVYRMNEPQTAFIPLESLFGQG